MLKYIKSKKWILSSLVPFLFLFSARTTYASFSWMDIILGPIGGAVAKKVGASIADTMAGVPILIVAFLSYALAYFAYWLAKLAAYVLGFILLFNSDLSYTNPAKNPIIKTGLDITIPFVNYILVISMVVIALATILRIKEYEAKRLLPKLIIVALLVNFAPLICGLAVDASNIVMNYFFGKMGDAPGLATLDSLWATKSSCTFDNFAMENLSISGALGATGLITTAAACGQFTIMFLLFGAIFYMFAIIFYIRLFAIWLLVILAPIAFACAILPRTRSYWEMWYNEFSKWVTIGISGGLFLFLGMSFASQYDVIFKGFKDSKGIIVTEIPMIGALLPGMIIIMFLAISLYYAIKSSGAATKIAIKTASWAAKGAMMVAGAATGGGSMLMATKAGQSALMGLAGQKNFGLNTLQGSKRINTISNPALKWGAKAAIGAGQVIATGTGLSWAARKAGAAGIRYQASIPAQVEKKEDEFKGMTADQAVAYGNSIDPFDYQRQMAHVNYIRKEFGGKGLAKLDPAYLKKVMGHYSKYSPKAVGETAKAMPNLIHTAELEPMITDNMKLKGTDANKKMAEIIAQTKPDDLGKLDRTMYEKGATGADIILKSLIHQKKTTNNQLRGFIEGQGQFGIERLEDILDALKASVGGATRGEALKRASPNKYKYLMSSAGAALGVDLSK